MGRYRKKPEEIEAMQYPGMRELADAAVVFAWLDKNNVIHRHNRGFVIEREKFEMLVLPGDWIIKNSEGKFYPCKPDIFNTTYEQVIDDQEESKLLYTELSICGAEGPSRGLICYREPGHSGDHGVNLENAGPLTWPA